jgi:hypothetical protein
MSFGGNFTRLDDWADNWNTVPSITLGLNTTNDPAESMFTAANFPARPRVIAMTRARSTRCSRAA